ncbi:hypothetical protein GCM10025773_22370 [Microbacterium jejuense]
MRQQQRHHPRGIDAKPYRLAGAVPIADEGVRVDPGVGETHGSSLQTDGDTFTVDDDDGPAESARHIPSRRPTTAPAPQVYNPTVGIVDGGTNSWSWPVGALSPRSEVCGHAMPASDS